MTRLRTISAIVTILAVAALGAVILLGARADASRSAQVRVGALNLALSDLISAPFAADQSAEGPSAPARVRAEIRADEAALTQGLAAGSGLVSAGSSAAVQSNLSDIELTVDRIYRISARASGVDGSRQIPALQHTLSEQTARLSSLLEAAGRADAHRASRVRLEAGVGTALAMLALLAGFLLFYARSDRARRENELLLGISRQEARTDALTSLGNRRALKDDLAAMGPLREGSAEVLLAILDLNGFKQYNDAFGHSAGDALLSRLGQRFAEAVGPSGSAYRMGGDEFCLLARCDSVASKQLLADAASALTEHGHDWRIGCSQGAVRMPAEAHTAAEALRIADDRMYLDKADRSTSHADLAR